MFMTEKIEYLKSMGVNCEEAISNMIDIETYSELMNDFYNSLKEELEKINNYKNNSDMQNYAILVHALKSNAKSFGFVSLGNIAYNHEMASKQNDINYVNEHYNELLEEIKKVKKIIETYNAL